MKISASITTSLVAAATLIGACSSTPSMPKIDTSGQKGPPGIGSGGGSMGGSSADDGGTVVVVTSDDGGTITVGIDAGSCASGGCTGCCDNLSRWRGEAIVISGRAPDCRRGRG